MFFHEPGTKIEPNCKEEKNMNCPNCREIMTTTLSNSLQLDVCANCGGAWFDTDELDKMKDQVEPDASWLDFDLWKDTDALTYTWSERACPICSKPMAVVAYGDTGVNIDACVEHHGTYLDKGEFEAILQALEDEITEKDVPAYLRETLHEGKEVLIGDHGRHHEWKDFATVVRLLADRIMVENPTFARALAEFALASPK
jgi:Zn-finger nucleic acid-binding protein